MPGINSAKPWSSMPKRCLNRLEPKIGKWKWQRYAMIDYFWFNFGLQRFTQFDLIVLVCAIYVACAIAGAVMDLVLSDVAFGAVINGVLIFLFMLACVVVYNETVEMIRYLQQPVAVLGGAFAIACTLVLALSIFKNRMSRDD